MALISDSHKCIKVFFWHNFYYYVFRPRRRGDGERSIPIAAAKRVKMKLQLEEQQVSRTTIP